MRRHVLLLGVVLAIIAAGCRFPVTVTTRHRPDLVVESVGNPPAHGTTVQSFTVSVATENIGSAAAKHSLTRLFLSLDDQPGDADAILGEMRVPRLRTGTGPYETSIDVTVPASVQAVAYHVVVCADATNRVKELNETNNCRASDGTISFAPPPPPPPGEGSSQALIAQDLDDGIIDYATSLEYRTWSLFRDPRVPSRYSALPSAGEDQLLFRELEAVFDSLPADVQAATMPYLVRPNDPASAFGPAPALQSAIVQEATAALDDSSSDTRCHEPATWHHKDWTPTGGAADDGFRVWVCAGSDTEADLFLGPAINTASSLWAPMTLAEPDGMGEPIPDNVNGNLNNGGNGKIDILIVHTADCQDAGCPLYDPDDPGSFLLGVEHTLDGTCHAESYPPRSCSGYITVNAGLVCPDASGCSNDGLKATLAHEFFHLLQDAHNADALSREVLRMGSNVVWENSWYYEASATWAGWYYAKDPEAYGHFVNAFQPNNRSLLEYGHDHRYGSWVWPLLMQRDVGPSAIFASWRDAELADDPKALDDAVDHNLEFGDHFRDLSVRNLNPSQYFEAGGVGLEADLWQTEVLDFPKDPHVHDTQGTIALGDQHVFVEVVAPLAADDTEFDIQDDAVRKVTIDIASMTHADTADIDVVGRLAPDGNGGPPTWHRVRGSGTKLTFCRDKASENFDLFYVVLSNHSRARDALAGGPDADASVQGAYTIKAENACQPDGLAGTLSWTLSYESNLSGGGVVNTDSQTEQGTAQLNLKRDPARPSALWYIDDGTSSFSVTTSGAGVYDDGSCRGESTSAGQASGAFSTYQDPYGRTPLLDAFALGARPVLDADTKFLGVFASIPYQVAVHSESTGLSCGGSSDSLQDTHAFTLPGTTIVCFPPGVDPVNGINSKLIGDWNNDAKQFEFACTASVTTENSVKTLTVTGLVSPA
jgi:CARDB/Family of unknown function (DUF6055)